MRTRTGKVNPFLFFLVTLVFVSFMSSSSYGVIIVTEIINATEDTTINERSDTDVTDSWRLQNDSIVGFIGCLLPSHEVNSLFKFNFSNSTNFNRILELMEFNITVIDGGAGDNTNFTEDGTTVSWKQTCASGIKEYAPIITAVPEINITDNITWNTKPSAISSVFIEQKSFLTNQITGHSASVDISNITFLLDQFYKETQISFEVKSNETLTSCNIGRSTCYVAWNTSDSNQPFGKPNIKLSFTDFLTASVFGTDTVATYFDFETGHAQSSAFDEADFVYDINDAKITPLGGATMSFGTSKSDSDNDLIDFNCPLNGGWLTDTITNVNIPLGTFDIICFNLSSEHGNRDFFGGIKVINNTNVRGNFRFEFDFYHALYGAEWFQIFSVRNRPANPIPNQTVFIEWETSQDANSTIFWRLKKVGENYSAWSRQDNTTVTKSHSLNISNEFILESYFYQYYVLSGTLNETNGGIFYNFSVGSGVLPDLPTSGCGGPLGQGDANCSYIPEAAKCVDEGTCFICETTECFYQLFGLIILMIITITGFYVGNFIMGLGTFTTGTIILVTIGFLPTWLLTPILILVALIVANWVRQGFGGD